ncbi:nitroreductase family protein [Maribacter arenosus]|uniref:nitroreductase family protein n=1 Tax=Maribacter arenosus TaxID=1854708 RepID=UPI001CB7604C|nr:nitroreductase family protein [Maribacter arenosus]
MNPIWKEVRLLLRGTYRIISGLNGFAYDFKRFLFYGGWRENLSDMEIRNYNTVMAYHGLEKSLSFKNRNPTSGWGNAERVFLRLKIAKMAGDYGYHDKAAKQVLMKFLSLPENIELEKSRKMILEMNSMEFDSDDVHGAILYPLSNYKMGILKHPEDFFLSRYSLREFREDIVPQEQIKRALKLAMKTPSVCNRQAWHVFHSNDSSIIKKALSYQNGNRPFGDKIPNLMIVTTDLKAFFAGSEHYQHWIDGGLLSMSIMYALHSLGIASCPLNWSQTPKRDKQLRKAINISPNQTVIMMIAAGYPKDVNKVCSSTRRPLEEIFSNIELK